MRNKIIISCVLCALAISCLMARVLSSIKDKELILKIEAEESSLLAKKGIGSFYVQVKEGIPYRSVKLETGPQDRSAMRGDVKFYIFSDYMYPKPWQKNKELAEGSSKYKETQKEGLKKMQEYSKKFQRMEFSFYQSGWDTDKMVYSVIIPYDLQVKGKNISMKISSSGTFEVQSTQPEGKSVHVIHNYGKEVPITVKVIKNTLFDK